MKPHLIGGLPAADDREQIGRFLRYAFRLDLRSFDGLPSDLKDDAQAKVRSRH